MREFLGHIHTREMAPSGEIVGPPRPALAAIRFSNWKWTSLQGKCRVSVATCGRVGVTLAGSSPETQRHALPGCSHVTRRNAWPWRIAPLPAERAAHSRARWTPVGVFTLTLASERAGVLRERDVSLQVNTLMPEPKGHPVFEPEQEYRMVGGTARSLSLTKEFGFVAAQGGSHDGFVRLSPGESLGGTSGHEDKPLLDRSLLKDVGAPTAQPGYCTESHHLVSRGGVGTRDHVARDSDRRVEQ
jgi:hypothetical protein